MNSSGDRRQLGARIRQARTQARLSQGVLAARAGLSPTTWGRIERGEDTATRGTTFAAVERALGWDLGTLQLALNGEEPTLPVNTVPHAIDHIGPWEEAMIREVWAKPGLSEDTRGNLTTRVRVNAAEARALEDRLRRSAG